MKPTDNLRQLLQKKMQRVLSVQMLKLMNEDMPEIFRAAFKDEIG
jgi:hypothetical protein